MHKPKWAEGLHIDIEDLKPPISDFAYAIGLDATLALIDVYGGRNVYIPVADALLSKVRRERVVLEFDGSNEKKLARKYGLPASKVRQIIAEH